MNLSVVVPCYNEQSCLQTLYDRVRTACAAAVGDDYEIVMINDGSSDLTWPMMSALSGTDPHVVAVNLSRNHGHQLALSAGLSLARGDKILVIDADLQDPPELLAPMLAMMDSEKADIVYGQRRSRTGESWFKKVTAAGFYRVLKQLSDIDIPIDTGDFRLLTRRALNVFLSMPEQHRFIRGMMAWIGFRQVAFQYDRDARFAGETKYPFKRMMRLTIDALTGFSMAPLRLASHLGVVLGFVGVLLLAYTGIGWASGKAIAGWTSLMCVVIILGSAQMLILGLIGEYLGRLYMQSKGRPMFIIADVIGQSVYATQPVMPEAEIVFPVHALQERLQKIA
jgi:polyisoprenyl-phosphate glycosyltransferase